MNRVSQRSKNNAGNAFANGGNPLFKLSATMVELSLRHIQDDSASNLPKTYPINTDSAQPKLDPTPNTVCTSDSQRNNAQLVRKFAFLSTARAALRRLRKLFQSCIAWIRHQGGKPHRWLWVGSTSEGQSNNAQLAARAALRRFRKLSQICISWIRNRRDTPRRWLWVGMGTVALVLLGLTFVSTLRGYRHHSGSVKSQLPPALQHPDTPSPPAASVTPENKRKDTDTVTPPKPKSRRHPDDYVAKDTYITYGRGGKPNH